MPYPLRFNRIAVPKPWAAGRVPAMFPEVAADWPAGTGESVEVGDLPGATSVVAAGDWRDQTISALMRTQRMALLGQLAGADDLPDFPLCIKLLDTRDPLSVQVHPSDEFRRGRRAFRGKSEGWYILRAEPEAAIWQGLRPGLTLEDFRDALRNNRALEALNRREVKAGQWLFNPAGMIHALGGGLTLLEIQQNCDRTFRLWDPPRPGGLRRELHLAEGMSAARGDLPLPGILTPGEDAVLHDSGAFGVRHLHLENARHLTRTWAGFTAVTCVEGGCEITCRGGNRLEAALVRAPDTMVVPATFTTFEFYPDKSCRLVLSWARAS